jgi:hypothetical protein
VRPISLLGTSTVRPGETATTTQTSPRELLPTRAKESQPTQIWKTHVACARLARARGDGEAAFQAMQAAAAVLETLKSGVRNTELLSSLRANVRLPADIT